MRILCCVCVRVCVCVCACVCRTRDNRSPLQLAITRRLPSVVEVLCQRGADLNAVDENGTMPLWAALMSKQMDIATTLVCAVFPEYSQTSHNRRTHPFSTNISRQAREPDTSNRTHVLYVCMAYAVNR